MHTHTTQEKIWTDLQNQILNISSPIRKSKYPQLYQQILDATKFLPSTAKIKERIFCTMQRISSTPTCAHCKTNAVTFLGPATGYRTYCSTVCSSNSLEKQKDIKATNLSRYGTATPAQSNTIQQKTIDTLESKYGKGIRSTQQVDCVRDKTNATNLEKYGTEWYTNSEAGKQKITSSFLGKYGTKRFTQTDEYKQQFQHTCLVKYNRLHHKQQHISEQTLVDINNKDWLINQHHILQKPVQQIAKECNVGQTLIHTKFELLNIEQKHFYSSAGEGELIEFIKSIYKGPIITRTKQVISPQELDVLLPDLNLAFEYDGIYWHSENKGKNKHYHINKKLSCEQVGVTLIQIYDVEWNTQQEIVKSRIAHKLQSNNRVYARKCVVKVLSQQEASLFLNQTHTQGSCSSSLQYGLYYNDTLVAVMTFGASRYDKQHQYELLRYATTPMVGVVGGAGKLFQYFIKTNNPQSIISYCDRRWGAGQVYTNLGMKLIDTTPPNYYYFKPNQLVLMSRQQFQKHKLKNMLDTYSPKLSEWENMKNNGYYRIWNCGNLKFSWKR